MFSHELPDFDDMGYVIFQMGEVGIAMLGPHCGLIGYVMTDDGEAHGGHSLGQNFVPRPDDDTFKQLGQSIRICRSEGLGLIAGVKIHHD